MDTSKLIDILAYTIPSLVTGCVAYYFFTAYFAEMQQTRKFQLQNEANKQALPLRLQAYERLTLFLERINPNKLLLRVSPISDNKNDYANYLISQIEQELEHNLTQQLYISDEAWTIILTAKNSTIQMIRKVASEANVNNADQLREQLLQQFLEKQTPSHAALAFLKNEVAEMW